jgi:hypothetical protein
MIMATGGGDVFVTVFVPLVAGPKFSAGAIDSSAAPAQAMMSGMIWSSIFVILSLMISFFFFIRWMRRASQPVWIIALIATS